MKINLNFEYDKLHLKEVTILIPKYHPNMVSFLTPILGLYGINVKEFITDFEQKTKFISYDVIIPIRVKISKIKTFEILVKTPYVISILSQISSFSLTKPDINILTFYKLCLIKSIFSLSNQLLTLQNMIYISIRKYISLLTKVFSSISVKKPLLTFVSSLDPVLLQIKKNFNFVLLFKLLVYGKYGVFVSFNNMNNSHINYLSKSLSIFNIGLVKFRSKLLNMLLFGNYFNGLTYYLYSYKLSYIYNFYKQFSTSTFFGGMFPIYYRINSNLLTVSFFKVFLSDYSKFKNTNILSIVLFLSRIVLYTLNHLNLNLLKLLKYNYHAYLSSNISKS